MSVPCIFTPRIKRGGEVEAGRRRREGGERERERKEEINKEGRDDGSKERKRWGERGRWKGTISMG